MVLIAGLIGSFTVSSFAADPSFAVHPPTK